MIPLAELIKHDIPLAGLTTIGLGGNAKLFVTCDTQDHVREAIRYARKQQMHCQIIGGGSNIIFGDSGFDGLVMKIGIKGVTLEDVGTDVHLSAAAGEEWDRLVTFCVQRGLSGIECLSGIPGLVGAVPIQNVGAYGQEVRDSIVSVLAIDIKTLEDREFSNEECQFGYRQSRFKRGVRDRFVVSRVTFRLKKNGRPSIRYPELRKHIDASFELEKLPDGYESLNAVRNSVLALRRNKSMVLDPADENTRSVGSFFMNPIVNRSAFSGIQERWKGSGGSIPSFPAEGGVKIPAAWLVENSGFHKGFRKGGVGISENHALALVNRGGTSAELIALAREIQQAVRDRFGISLEPEPVLVS